MNKEFFKTKIDDCSHVAKDFTPYLKQQAVKEALLKMKIDYGLYLLQNDRMDAYNFGIFVDKIAKEDLGIDLEEKE